MSNLVSQAHLEDRILIIRGQKVMIDRDLASLFGVETKYLNRQVKRNPDRFPKEFMFQLNHDEKQELVTNWHQFAPLRHSRNLPHAFTEHGVAMLATVLNSEQSIKMSILIVKTFVRLREFIASREEMDSQLRKLEMRVGRHDDTLNEIIETLKNLSGPGSKPRITIGFKLKSRQGSTEGTNSLKSSASKKK